MIFRMIQTKIITICITIKHIHTQSFHGLHQHLTVPARVETVGRFHSSLLLQNKKNRNNRNVAECELLVHIPLVLSGKQTAIA